MIVCLKVVCGTQASGDPSEQTLNIVEAGKGDAGCHGAFHKVHGQTLVQTPNQALLSEMFNVAGEIFHLRKSSHRTNK